MSRSIIKVRKHQSIANTSHSPAAINKRSFSMLHKGYSPYLHQSPSHINVESTSPGRKKKPNLTSVRQIKQELSNETQFLEVRLQEKLKALESKGSFIIEDKMRIYQEIFDEVIEKDRIFGGLLKSIKEAYDEWCTEKNLPLYEKLIKDFEETIQGLNHKIESLYKENKKNTNHFKKVALENYELAKKLEDKDKSLIYLKKNCKKLLKESNEAAFDDETAGVRNSETEKVKQMSSLLKSYELKEKQLIAFILLLKENGCPVENIYNEQFRPESIAANSNPTSSVSPNSVPKLNFSFLRGPSSSFSPSEPSPMN